MSSDEREDDTDRNAGLSKDKKMRNVQRACDACRRKKTRCDGSKVPHIRCTNCVLYNYDCTYVENAKKRSPPKSYVESLEKRVAKLQQLLGKIAPEALNQSSNTTIGPPDRRLSPPINPVSLSAISNNPSSGPVHDIELDDLMSDALQDLSIGRGTRFFGEYSGVMLHQATLQLKHDYITGSPGSFIPEFPPVPMHKPDPTHGILHSFPEHDLMQSLIELYFTHQNILFPLFHRPTFEKCVAGGLHLFNIPFAEKLLLVCAIGTRYCDDPRVLSDDNPVPQSRGWKWFSQVELSRELLIKTPTTDGMQFCCLVAIYLHGTSTAQASWRFIGLGLRVAEDMGAHRRKAPNSVPTVRDELTKRAFWTLLLLDRLLSLTFGRPCAMHDEDYDVDLPIECDDEYWDHPDSQKRFKQPVNKPSASTYFIYQIKLCKILAFLLRTIYSVDKSKILLGFADQGWEKSVVSELGAALDEFVDSIPIHLKWDPDREDRVFFEQSGALYSTLYYLQMLVYRPFILQPDKRTALCLPPLTLCINAARSCSRVAGAQARRSVIIDFPVQAPIFFSGVVLLISIWGGKRLGLTTDPQKDLECVHKCMDVLKATETRLFSAGRLWDILHDLASIEIVPLPSSVSSTNKRERDEDKPESFLASAPIPSTTPVDPPIAQPLGMPRNVVMPERLPWDNTSSAVQAGSATHARSLHHPQMQWPIQPRPPLRRSKSQTSHLQAPQQTGGPLLSRRIHSINTELGRQPQHYQSMSTFFNQRQEMHPYSADTQYWSRPFDAGSDNIAQSSVRSTAANPQIYPQTRPMPPFQIIDNSIPNDAIRIEHPSEAYTYSSSVDNAHYYHPQASTSAIADDVPSTLHYARPPQPQLQQSPTSLENNAYGSWPWAPTGFGWDDWARTSVP